MTVRLDTEDLRPKQVKDQVFLQWPSGEEANGFREQAAESRERFNHAVEEAESLLSDERFSEEGHRQRLADEESLQPHRGWLETKLKRVEEDLYEIRQRREQFSPFDEPDASDSRAAVREREVRDHLREMDTVERREMLVEAAEEGRDEVLRAALDAPGGFSPVGDATRELVEERALEARHGEEITELKEREQNLRRLHRELDAAVSILSDPDTLMDVAAPDEEA